MTCAERIAYLFRAQSYLLKVTDLFPKTQPQKFKWMWDEDRWEVKYYHVFVGLENVTLHWDRNEASYSGNFELRGYSMGNAMCLSDAMSMWKWAVSNNVKSCIQIQVFIQVISTNSLSSTICFIVETFQITFCRRVQSKVRHLLHWLELRAVAAMLLHLFEGIGFRFTEVQDVLSPLDSYALHK